MINIKLYIIFKTSTDVNHQPPRAAPPPVPPVRAPPPAPPPNPPPPPKPPRAPPIPLNGEDVEELPVVVVFSPVTTTSPSLIPEVITVLVSSAIPVVTGTLVT